jgi:hypothetical protein
MSPGKKGRKQPMSPSKTEAQLIELAIVFILEKLAEQYKGMPDHEKFLGLLAKLRGGETAEGTPSEEHKAKQLAP